MIYNPDFEIYLPNGYLDAAAIIDSGYPFIFVHGPRGVGKTYGFLQQVLLRELPTIFMRRTQAQIDLINKPEYNPCKSPARDSGIEIATESLTKYTAAIYKLAEDESKLQVITTAALTTFANLRGFDASETELLLFDEYIPERHERPIKRAGTALLNAYETINRNRELSGRRPLQMICMGNANGLSSEILMELQLLEPVEEMQRAGLDRWHDDDRGVLILNVNASRISESKRGTALYRFNRSTDFAGMALDNSFEEIRHSTAQRQDWRAYRPLARLGELTIYEHKSSGRYYISKHRSGTPPEYEAHEDGIRRFCREQAAVVDMDAIVSNTDYESTTVEVIYKNYIGY